MGRCFRLKEQKIYKKTKQNKKLASIVLFSFKGLVFLTFFFFCSFFSAFTKNFFSVCFFCFFCKSKTAAPSGGSQVDIADVCRGGGLIQLVQAFPAGAPLCLLVLLLLLPAFAQTAQQHTFDLLLALFENILNIGKRKGRRC